MSVDQTRLDAAATERKARLAKLASLKRKRPEDGTVDSTTTTESDARVTNKYISGRNFDLTSDAPKLGFEQAPNAQHETVEEEAARLAKVAADQAAKDEAEGDQGIDLFKLQPKKPNWDLKRDLAERTRVLDVRTQNAIAKLVRERIQKAKEEASSKPSTSTAGEGEELGVEGSTLVEAVHLREKEDEEERKRQIEEDEDIP